MKPVIMFLINFAVLSVPPLTLRLQDPMNSDCAN